MNWAAKNKTDADMLQQWDALAKKRIDQITGGSDLTYNMVLSPEILSMVDRVNPASVIDVGCGVGALTHSLSKRVQSVFGLDPSAFSIKIARETWTNVDFLLCSVEEYAYASGAARSDAVVANMVLMNVLSLSKFLQACRAIIRPGGALIFSITHPWFWPKYYGYSDKEWFKYNEEVVIESPFRISNDPLGSLTSTHVHRPLQMYVEAFRKAEFHISEIREPMPAPDIEHLYPAPWRYPRYLVGICSAI